MHVSSFPAHVTSLVLRRSRLRTRTAIVAHPVTKLPPCTCKLARRIGSLAARITSFPTRITSVLTRMGKLAVRIGSFPTDIASSLMRVASLAFPTADVRVSVRTLPLPASTAARRATWARIDVGSLTFLFGWPHARVG